MKSPRLLISVAVAVCAFAINVQAQTTNTVTFKATLTIQGPETTVQGTNNSFAVEKPTGLSTAELIGELGTATSHQFSKAAKLVLVDGEFAVIDGITNVDVSGIMTLTPGTNFVQSGVQNGDTDLAFRTLKQMIPVEVDFNDIGLHASDLQFSLRGLASGTTTDTVPSTNGVYTETFSAKITDMTGGGTKGGTNFVATGSVSASGKGELSL
ncbi:MAG TPA: hypothetical protein VKV04_14145 [Verrucomicrobiae bacterium]|nr:hypothetical protein [Verrucomicrobiae bacterium]